MRSLVNRYWHAIAAVAEGLIERQILTGDEIDLIIAEAEGARRVADARAARTAWAETIARAARFTEVHGLLIEQYPR